MRRERYARQQKLAQLWLDARGTQLAEGPSSRNRLQGHLRNNSSNCLKASQHRMKPLRPHATSLIQGVHWRQCIKQIATPPDSSATKAFCDMQRRFNPHPRPTERHRAFASGIMLPSQRLCRVNSCSCVLLWHHAPHPITQRGSSAAQCRHVTAFHWRSLANDHCLCDMPHSCQRFAESLPASRLSQQIQSVMKAHWRPFGSPVMPCSTSTL